MHGLQKTTMRVGSQPRAALATDSGPFSRRQALQKVTSTKLVVLLFGWWFCQHNFNVLHPKLRMIQQFTFFFLWSGLKLPTSYL